MNKNIVFIINVKTGAGKPEYEISIESWRRWCDKNEVEVVFLDEPVLPMEDMHIIWQRYFLFDIFDFNEIEPNQVLLVDADTIVHPDCPNFFNQTEDKYCLIHDDGSYDCSVEITSQNVALLGNTLDDHTRKVKQSQRTSGRAYRINRRPSFLDIRKGGRARNV